MAGPRGDAVGKLGGVANVRARTGGHADEDTDSDNDPMDQDEHDLEDDGSSDGNGASQPADCFSKTTLVEMDADESEARRREALEHMARIEKEFAELKDRLYQEKMLGLTKEIEQVNDGAFLWFGWLVPPPLSQMKCRVTQRLCRADQPARQEKDGKDAGG